MKLKLSIFLNIALFIAVAFLIYRSFAQADKIVSQSISNPREYPLLAKRIFVEDPNDVIINFYDLRQELRGYIQNGNKPISLYFQYLPTGTSIGVNDNISFIAASLLKLPTAMYVQKLIEKGEVDPERKITLTEDLLDQNYGDLWKEGPGFKISVVKLLEKSLIDSDNTAHNALFHTVSEGSPEEVYNNLDIPRQVIKGSPAITVKNYSSILRALYFSSYLNFEGSQKILSMLTRIVEGSNLRSDIPQSVQVAQKIGVYEVGDDDEKFVYSDCGIFYVPRRPYLLCIMSQGDKETSSEYASNISSMVYRYLVSINTQGGLER